MLLSETVAAGRGVGATGTYLLRFQKAAPCDQRSYAKSRLPKKLKDYKTSSNSNFYNHQNAQSQPESRTNATSHSAHLSASK